MTRTQGTEGRKVGPRIQREIRRFLTKKGFRPVGDDLIPPFNYAELRDSLFRPVTPKALETIARDLADPAFGESYWTVLTRAHKYLQDRFPRRVRQTSLGKDVTEPDLATVHKFRRVWGVAIDPIRALRSLNYGTLVAEEVVTLADLYPRLYDAITATVFETVVDIRTTRPEWRPPWRKEQLLALLQQLPAEGPKAADQLEKAEAAAKQGQPSALADIDFAFREDAQTTTQRQAAR